MNLDDASRGATTPWRGPAHYRDLGSLLFQAIAAGLIASLALALAVLIATTTARGTDTEAAPRAEAPVAVGAGDRT